VNTKSDPQSMHFKILSWNSIGEPLPLCPAQHGRSERGRIRLTTWAGDLHPLVLPWTRPTMPNCIARLLHPHLLIAETETIWAVPPTGNSPCWISSPVPYAPSCGYASEPALLSPAFSHPV
jgi:hypothetical protein